MSRDHVCKKKVTAVILISLLATAIPAQLIAQEKSPEVREETPVPVQPENFDRTGSGIIMPGETLNVNQIVEIALKKNPSRSAAASIAEAFRSRIGQARANYYPQVNATAQYNRATSRPTASLFSPFLLRNRYDQFAATGELSQTIFDFGRTSASVGAAKYNYKAARLDLENTTDLIILNVKQAYYRVLAAKHGQDVAEQVVKRMQLHLDQAKGFYEVGTHPKIDVAKAEVDLSNAQLDLIRAQNELRIAWVNLNNTIGVPDAPEYSIEDDLEVHKYEVTLEDVTQRAFENRPDLQGLIAQEHAADKTMSFYKRDYYPVLSGSARYLYSGTEYPGLDSEWSAGVTLTFPLFSGFLTRHRVAEAKSNLYKLKFDEETLRQKILLEIRQAFLALRESEESISAAQVAVKHAQENLDLANGRYAAGVGNPIEVSDAFSDYTRAQASYTTALYNHKIARASIEKAMGAR